MTSIESKSAELDDNVSQKTMEKDVLSNFGHSLYSVVRLLESEQDSESMGNAGSRENVDVVTNLVKPIREMIYKAFRQSDNEAIQDVLSQIHQILVSATNEKSESTANSSAMVFNQPIMGDLLVRCLAHYLCMSVPPSWLNKLCRYMLERIGSIVKQFLNFKHYFACHFSFDDKRARLFVLQCALHRRFPLLASEGCSSILWNQGMLSVQSVEIAGRAPAGVDDGREDVGARNERDQSKGKLPCVVMCTHMDNLDRIRKICDRHGLWLHVEGASTSLLLAASSSLPTATRVMMSYADSISCQPFEWFQFRNDSKSYAKNSPANAFGVSSSSSHHHHPLLILLRPIISV
ncbi:hypothetical protein RFI_23281, partial [Reticulomyxa filosa]